MDTVKMRNMLPLSVTENHTLADPVLLRREGGGRREAGVKNLLLGVFFPKSKKMKKKNWKDQNDNLRQQYRKICEAGTGSPEPNYNGLLVIKQCK